MASELEPTIADTGRWGILADHLLQIPGAAAAIARLLGKTAQLGEAWLDIPTAEGQRRAQAVRDDQAARTAMLKVVQDAAGERAITNAALLDRAIASFVDSRLRKQTNKEAVVKQAVEELIKDPPPIDAPSPNGDWMNFYEEMAEKASSAELQSLLARVLAGEIRKQGSFSRQALHFFAVLDQHLASVVQSVASCVVSNAIIPVVGKFQKGQDYSNLVDLASLGLLHLGSAQYFNINKPAAIIHVGNKPAIIAMSDHPTECRLNGAVFTLAGRQVFSLLSTSPDEQFIDAVVEQFHLQQVSANKIPPIGRSIS